MRVKILYVCCPTDFLKDTVLLFSTERLKLKILRNLAENANLEYFRVRYARPEINIVIDMFYIQNGTVFTNLYAFNVSLDRYLLSCNRVGPILS